MLLGFAAGYTLIHCLTWTLVRYRLPVDALLVPFAALALVRSHRAAGAWLALVQRKVSG